MSRFKSNSKKYKRILIEYVISLLIIELIIVLVNISMISVSTSTTVLTEISKVRSPNIATVNSENNHKMDIEKNGELSYYIKVNYREQIVTVYTLDEQNQYTVPVRTMICSTGVATPQEGVFGISDKYEWRCLLGNVYGQYATRITGQILFHSVPYTSQDKSSLEYWEYDKLGQPVSKGCVRLTVEDAKWIFDNCEQGTEVEFCGEDSQEKIVTKETTLKISDYSEELRNWDPTDPDPNNPWMEYKELDEGESIEL